MRKIIVIAILIYFFGVALCWTGVRNCHKDGRMYGKPQFIEAAMCFVPVANIIWGTLFHLHDRDFSKFFNL